MTVLLENVSDEHLSVLRELAKVLDFQLREVGIEDAELQRRIESYERGETRVVTPDWASILQQAKAIQ